MRQLKFRAWNTEIMQFEYFELHNITVPDRLLCQYKYPDQQYTGLKDKNGVEIYEGDILERIGNGSFCKIVIYWDDHNCAFISKNSFNLHGEGSPISDHNINISDWTYWVVCGNIFDNPELLEA